MTVATAYSTAFAMPSRWTFEIAPVAAFVARHTAGKRQIVDPFCGRSGIAHHRTDISFGTDAEAFLVELQADGVRADCVIFDPPYSPRQVSECYRAAGRAVTKRDTQSARLHSAVRLLLAGLLEPNGVALSFGWQSNGFGRDWPTDEILLVQHGSGHNDTICVAQRKPPGGAA